MNRDSLAELTNEESVDDRSPSLERNSIISDSSSSSSNDTLKMRGSLVHMSADEQDDSISNNPARSSVMLLGKYSLFSFLFYPKNWLVVYLQEVLFRESRCLYLLIINYQSSEVLSNIHVISQEARTIVVSLKYQFLHF